MMRNNTSCQLKELSIPGFYDGMGIDPTLEIADESRSSSTQSMTDATSFDTPLEEYTMAHKLSLHLASLGHFRMKSGMK